MNYQKQCEDIYYASDVCDKTLSFGCELQFIMETPHIIKTQVVEVWDDGIQTTSGNERYPKDRFKIIGHPPKLNDWLRLLEKKKPNTVWYNNGHIYLDSLFKSELNLDTTTGQPTTEEDWRKLLEIIK